MRLLFTVSIIAVMISSTIVSWSFDFFDIDEKIEWSNLFDGETEDSKEESQKDADEKINQRTNNHFSHFNSFNSHEWENSFLFAHRYREIVTPPPELS